MEIRFRVTEVIDFVPEIVFFLPLFKEDRYHLFVAAKTVILVLASILRCNRAYVVDITVLVYGIRVRNHNRQSFSGSQC